MAPRLPTRVAHVAGLAVPDDGHPTQLGVVAPGTAGASAVAAAVTDRFEARGVPVLRLAGRRRRARRTLRRRARPGAWARRRRRGARLARRRRRPPDRRGCRPRGRGRPVARRAVAAGGRRRWPSGPPTAASAWSSPTARSPATPTSPPSTRCSAAANRSCRWGRSTRRTWPSAAPSSWSPRSTTGWSTRSTSRPRAWPTWSRRSSPPGPARASIEGGRLAATPPSPSPALVAAVRPRDRRAGPVHARTVLEALSAGADLDDELLSATTDVAPDDLGDAIDDLSAAGLLVGTAGDVVPLVAAVVTAMVPVADRRRFHARLAAALARAGRARHPHRRSPRRRRRPGPRGRRGLRGGRRRHARSTRPSWRAVVRPGGRRRGARRRAGRPAGRGGGAHGRCRHGAAPRRRGHRRARRGRPRPRHRPSWPPCCRAEACGDGPPPPTPSWPAGADRAIVPTGPTASRAGAAGRCWPRSAPSPRAAPLPATSTGGGTGAARRARGRGAAADAATRSRSRPPRPTVRPRCGTGPRGGRAARVGARHAGAPDQPARHRRHRGAGAQRADRRPSTC